MGDLPNDVRTAFRESEGYEILKRLLLVEKTIVALQNFR